MLFKYTYNPNAPESQQDDSLVRYCAAFSPELDLYSIQEIIEDCEETYLRPFLGELFLTQLQDSYALYPGTPLPSGIEPVIRKLQAALAYYVAFEFLGNRALRLTDTGPGEVVSSDGSYVFSRQWRTQVSLRKFFQTASRRMDRAIEYIESTSSSHLAYLPSDAYAKYHKLFFRNAAELAAYLPMDADRVVFQMLRPSIDEAEQRYIYRLIGDDLAAEIKAQLASDSLTLVQRTLLDKIRWALARWARICAIPSLRLRINESGLVEPDFNLDANHTATQPSREETVRSLWVSDQVAAREFLSELKSWLWQNADSFPTWRDSELYDSEQPPSGFMDNFHEDPGGVTSFL